MHRVADNLSPPCVPYRRFIGTLLTDPPSDGLLDAPRSAWAYAHLADAPEMPVVER